MGERHEGGECYPLGCLARAGLAGGEPSAEQELRRRRMAAAVRRVWTAASWLRSFTEARGRWLGVRWVRGGAEEGFRGGLWRAGGHGTAMAGCARAGSELGLI